MNDQQSMHTPNGPEAARGRQQTPWWKGRSVEEYVGSSLMLAMVLVLFVQIIARYVFSSSLSWSEELARYMFIWMVFIALGAVVLKGEHIVIDTVVSRVSAATRRVTEQIVQLIMFVINVVIIVFGFQLVVTMAGLGQRSAGLDLPMWIVYLAVPVGLVLATLRTVQASARIWTRDTLTVAGHDAGLNEGEV